MQLTRTRPTSSPSIFENILGSDFPDLFRMETGMTVPAVNVSETNDKYKIEVAAPGLKKEDFKINLENKVLTISSEREESKEDKNEKYRRREFSYSSFERSFSLPEVADDEKIQATYANGILCIDIPKKEMFIKKQAKQIQIK